MKNYHNRSCNCCLSRDYAYILTNNKNENEAKTAIVAEKNARYQYELML
jgi:hypothetical protein